MDEAKLIDLFWRRDEDAIRCTAADYGNLLTVLATRITGNGDDARECVNDTYLAAWNSIPPTRPGSLPAYLAKICRHAAFDLVDKRNAGKRSAVLVELSQELQQCVPDRMAEVRLEGRLISGAINRFLGTLKPVERQIFLRRYWYGDTVNDIASAFGMRAGAVKTRLFRTREKLKTYLEQEGIDL